MAVIGTVPINKEIAAAQEHRSHANPVRSRIIPSMRHTKLTKSARSRIISSKSEFEPTKHSSKHTCTIMHAHQIQAMVS